MGNSSLGFRAGRGISTGTDNFTIGHLTMGQTTNLKTGDGNIAIGYNNLASATTAGYNTVVGHSSGEHLTTGDNNTMIGGGLGSIKTGDRNTGIGYQCLSNITGSMNDAVGYGAYAGQYYSYGVTNATHTGATFVGH